MSYMFGFCFGLYSLKVNGWDTGNVTNMSYMFTSCYGLYSLDVSGWSTANVTDMSDMFYDCEQLKSLDLSDWDTSKVTSMSSMFLNCFSLTSINMCDKNAVNVISMNKMFSGCKSLTSLDLSGWNTENVTDMSSMFNGCSSLTSLDLSGWSTDNVTDMSSMFNGCKELTTIYVWNGWNTENVQYSTDMFSSCTKLVGGSGTKYDFMYKDATYARIDCPPSNPGYFSSYVIEYNISIAGTKVSTLNMGDVLGNGIFSYSPSTNTLTIIGSYTITSGWDDIIYSNIEGLTIDVTQDAVLENKGSGNVIMLVKSTTIKGEGKLTLKSPDVTGIYLSGGAPVTIENMNMDIEAYWGIAGPTNGLTREKITIKSSNITITTSTSTALNPTDAAAISDLPGGIVLEDCSIIYPANATIQNKGVYLGNSNTLAKDVTIKAKVNIATDVNPIENGEWIIEKSMPLYNLQGQRVTHPVKGGIYIQNGKKRIIK
jgi:surface protein